MMASSDITEYSVSVGATNVDSLAFKIRLTWDGCQVTHIEIEFRPTPSQVPGGQAILYKKFLMLFPNLEVVVHTNLQGRQRVSIQTELADSIRIFVLR